VGGIIMKYTIKQKAFCPRCKGELRLENDEDLKKEYKYVCDECYENFYNFEAIKEEEKE
jgi:transposase-like protein